MSNELLRILAFAASLVAMGAFRRSIATSVRRARIGLRVAGTASVALALLLLLRADTASVAAVLWIMTATVAAIVVTLGSAWRAHRTQR